MLPFSFVIMLSLGPLALASESLPLYCVYANPVPNQANIQVPSPGPSQEPNKVATNAPGKLPSLGPPIYCVYNTVPGQWPIQIPNLKPTNGPHHEQNKPPIDPIVQTNNGDIHINKPCTGCMAIGGK